MQWRDNNGRGARTSFPLPAGLDVAAALVRANALRAAAVSLVDCQLTGAVLEYEDIIGRAPFPPADGADCRRNLVLFFRGESGFGSWRVPSPGALPYDASGEFATFRITRQSMLDFGLLQMIEDAAALTVMADGTPSPATFIVAGLDSRVV